MGARSVEKTSGIFKKEQRGKSKKNTTYQIKNEAYICICAKEESRIFTKKS